MVTPVAPSTSNLTTASSVVVISRAEEVMRLIADIYDRPSMDFS
jgi:hypothetical protein